VPVLVAAIKFRPKCASLPKAPVAVIYSTDVDCEGRRLPVDYRLSLCRISLRYSQQTGRFANTPSHSISSVTYAQREKNVEMSEEVTFMTNKAELLEAELKTVKENLNHAVAAKQRVEQEKKDIERKTHELEHNVRESQKHKEELETRTRERDECNSKRNEFENAKNACESQRSSLETKLKQLEEKVAALVQSQPAAAAQ